jgi:hypothetical protein
MRHTYASINMAPDPPVMLNEVKHLACECEVCTALGGSTPFFGQILRYAQDDSAMEASVC